MSGEETPPTRGGNLSMILTIIGTGLLVGFLILISNGILLYMMLGVLGIGGIGMLHYLLWGSDMERRAQFEREMEEEEEPTPRW
mgnify:CR=1 FL=1